MTHKDLMRQAQCEIDAAMAKRNPARKLWNESDEDMVRAQMKMQEAKRYAVQVQEQAGGGI